MILEEQIYAHTLLLAGDVEQGKAELLRLLCKSAGNMLKNRLREGLQPEDCKADFIAAASLYALSALADTDETGNVEQFQAGDLSIRRKGGSPAANCLHRQAELMIAPYLKDSFTFRGV